MTDMEPRPGTEMPIWETIYGVTFMFCMLVLTSILSAFWNLLGWYQLEDGELFFGLFVLYVILDIWNAKKALAISKKKCMIRQHGDCSSGG